MCSGLSANEPEMVMNCSTEHEWCDHGNEPDRLHGMPRFASCPAEFGPANVQELNRQSHSRLNFKVQRT